MNGPAWLAQKEPLITDWMQGWGSVLGLGASLIAIGVTATLLVHEIREARRGRQEASRERAEAQQDREAARRDRELAARERADSQMAHARAVIFRRAAVGRQNHRIGAEVTVVNYGTGPILELEIGIDFAGRGWTPVKAREDTLGPGGTELKVRDYEIAPDDGAWTESDPWSLVLRFTDMTGLRWERRNNGQPARLLEDPESIRITEHAEVRRSSEE